MAAPSPPQSQQQQQPSPAETKWDSAELRAASLYEGDFNPGVVMVSEDNEDITQFAEYLDQTAASGIRPKFTSINAQEIAKKVRKFLGMSSRTSITANDPRLDPKLWAEAIKHTLLQFKNEVASSTKKVPGESEEITGARSKDMMRYIPPIGTGSETADVGGKSSTEVGKGGKKKGKSKSKMKMDKKKSKGGKKGKKGGSAVSTDAETTETSDNLTTTDDEGGGGGKKKSKKNKKSKSKTGGETTEDEDEVGGGKGKKTKSKKSKSKSKSQSKDKLNKKKSKSKKKLIRTASLPLDGKDSKTEVRHTLLRKRGQAKMPLVTIEDDSPKDGPQLYVLLQGFYNPDIIDALHEIGVKVDGVVLLTRNKVEKRNFSVIDIEENFPDTFRPQNLLPDYLQKILKKYEKDKPGEKKDQVSKFWIDFAKKLNDAGPDSFIHDVALLNCEMPPIPLKLTGEEIAIHSVALLEEVAKRIYELHLFKSWHQTYTSSTKIGKIDLVERIEPANRIYDELISRVPAECVTLPVIMESLLAQVVYNVDEEEQAKKERELLDDEEEEDEEQEYNEDNEVRELFNLKRKKSSSGPQKGSKTKLKDKKGSEGKLPKKRSSKKSKDLDKKRNAKKMMDETEDEEEEEEETDQFTSGYPTQEYGPYSNNYDEEVMAAEDYLDSSPFAHDLRVDQRVARITSRPGKYYPYLSSEIQRQKSLNLCDPPTALAPIFKGPLYIKSHDFASIRTCHLEENFAAAIASDQVSGDFSHMRSFLWDGAPEFNKGLYMKLHGNLTHFMHFLPPDTLDFKDMFFILHLLLAVGIEIQLQKDSKEILAKEIAEACSDQDAICCDREGGTFRDIMALHEQSRLVEGTNLDLSHNYLALAKELDKASRFILAPGSRDKFKVVNSTPTPVEEPKKVLRGQSIGSVRPSCIKKVGVDKKMSKAAAVTLLKPQEEQNDEPAKKCPEKREKEEQRKSLASNVERIHGAAIATGNIILHSAEMAAKAGGDNKQSKSNSTATKIGLPLTPPNTANAEGVGVDSEGYRLYFGKGERKDGGGSNLNQGQGQDQRSRSLGGLGEGDELSWSCEGGTTPTDLSILQALIDCPALLAISESGAMDLSKWVETHLLCTGLTRAAGESLLIGNLKDWNWAEEMVPVQMIQTLSDAANSYLCMERMYCPFYDTILFIFNNPLPYSLHAEASFISKLRTVPGLQHFLEYTINDEDVQDFVMDAERRKGPLATVSVETLMRLIPEDQWILIPSIKYRLQKLERERRLQFETEEEGTEEGTGEEDESEGKKGLGLKAGRKTRKRNRIDLGDGEPRPDESEEEDKTDKDQSGDESGGGKKKGKGKKDKGSKSPKAKKSKSKTKGKGKSEEDTTDTDGGGKKGKKKKGKSTSDSEADTSAGGKKSKSKAKVKGKKSKSKTKVKGKKSKKGMKSEDETTDDGKERSGKLPDETETPLPILTPTDGSLTELHKAPKSGGGKSEESENEQDDKMYESKLAKTFDVYDLGKRIYVLTSDDFHMFPLDGTVITYNVSTIEPSFRMMQLKVAKNGHESIFYPYYIPEVAMGGAANLHLESFVLCPTFHTVLANGTVVAFQDLRAGEDLQNFKWTNGPLEKSLARPPGSAPFSLEQIRFLDQNYERMMYSRMRATRDEMMGEDGDEEDDEEEEDDPKYREGQMELNKVGDPNKKKTVTMSENTTTTKGDAKGGKGKGKGDKKEGEVDGEGDNPEETESKVSQKGKGKKGKSKSKEKLEKKKSKKNKDDDQEEEKGVKGKKSISKGKIKGKKSKSKAKVKGDKDKKKGKKGGKSPRGEKEDEPEDEDEEEEEGDEEEGAEEEEEGPGPRQGQLEKGQHGDEPVGEWKYPSSDETDFEDIQRKAVPSKTSINFGWEGAVPLLTPLVHLFKITLPSGLHIQVKDVPSCDGLPLTREVKQTYLDKGSAFSYVETCRYFTMNGSVIRFLTNGMVQILNARGTTTNIQEISAHVPDLNFAEDEDPRDRFAEAPHTRVWKGDVILSNGEFWHISYGKRVKCSPLFLFTSGTMPNGEIFRRRQDGTIFIHRNDGCCIIHYPDGTRFTTRMVKQRDPDPDFPDWEFIGLKYMIEHPNYSPVIFNTLSGNIHIRIPQGEWARIFADGSISFGITDDYKLDVNQYTAVLSCPSMLTQPPGTSDLHDIPNCVIVKLYHTFEHMRANSSSDDESRPFTPFWGEDGDLGPQKPHRVPKRPMYTSGTFSIHDDDDEEFEEETLDENNSGRGKKRPSQGQRPGHGQSQGQLPLGQMDKNLRPPPNRQQQLQFSDRIRPSGFHCIKTITLDDYPDLLTRNLERVQDTMTSARQPCTTSHFNTAFSREVSLSQSVADPNDFPATTSSTKVTSRASQPSNDPGSKPRSKANSKVIIGDETEKSVQKRLEIAQFFLFTDLWTLVKAIDSYDNRFAMDIFGQTVVDKSCKMEEAQCQSVNEMFDSLACSFALPKKLLSGLLETTSSEEMNTHAKRLNLLRRAHNQSGTGSGCCPRKPRTRILVVKRDLSGYEFLQEPQVDRIVRRGKINPDAMVLVDPLPCKQPRKFLTIMEPILNCENPNGVWKNVYREPVFRPRYLCNKNLKLARPEDVRWFAHILGRAHNKRGKFFLSPKDKYLLAKQRAEDKEREAIAAAAKAAEEEEEAALKRKAQAEEEQQKKRREAEEGDNEEEEEEQKEGQGKKAKGKKSKKKLDKSKSKSKEKVGKKEKKGKSKSKVKIKDDDEDKDKDGDKPKAKKSKSKAKKSESKVGKKDKGKKKGKKGKTAPETPEERMTEDTEEEEDEEEMEEEDNEEGQETEAPPEVKRKPKLIGQKYPGDYPPKLGDVKGLYGDEPVDGVMDSISPYHHTDLLPPRKAIVVKTILELPKLDENLQSLLLGAAASYAKIAAEDKKVLNAYSAEEDPRSQEEIENERRVRRELIEENIQQMKMLQQSAGKILDLVI